MPSVSNVLRRLIVQNLALFRFCLLRDATVIALRSLRCVFSARVLCPHIRRYVDCLRICVCANKCAKTSGKLHLLNENANQGRQIEKKYV